MRSVLVAIVASTFVLGSSAPAEAKWRSRTCGYISANGLRNQYVTSGKYALPSCRKARSVLTTFLRTRHRNVGQWRCTGTRSNGAVLGQCTQHNLFIAVYDARWGE